MSGECPTSLACDGGESPDAPVGKRPPYAQGLSGPGSAALCGPGRMAKTARLPDSQSLTLTWRKTLVLLSLM